MHQPQTTWPEIRHHGAVDGVTGSAHELCLDHQHSLLVDCGLFQGRDQGPGGANADDLTIDFPVAQIKTLVITHVHIDHVGRIPWLLAAGFKGPILCSQPSAKLLLGSPAVQLVRWSQSAFPALLPGGVIDSHPMMKPVRPDVSEKVPHDG